MGVSFISKISFVTGKYYKLRVGSMKLRDRLTEHGTHPQI